MSAKRTIVNWALALMTAGAALLGRGDAAGGPKRPDAPDQMIVIDVSTSMQQDRSLEQAKAAATLACALLEGRVAIAAFSDGVELSPIYDLATRRVEAMSWLAKLAVKGGTRYLRALDA